MTWFLPGTWGSSVVTHDGGAASFADRVVFLADGRVVDELFAPTVDSVLERMKRLDATTAAHDSEA